MFFRRRKNKRITKIILSLLIFWVLNIIIPLVYIKAIDFYNLKDFYTLEKADVLIMGDSHTQYAIDPKLFEEIGVEAKNYSMPGHYPLFDYYFYENYKKKFGAPKIVIISTPYFIFEDSNYRFLNNLLDDEDFEKYYFENSIFSLINFHRYSQVFQESPSLFSKIINGEPPKQMAYGYFSRENKLFYNQDLNNRPPVEVSNKINYEKDGLSIYSWRNKTSLNYFRLLLSQLAEDGVAVYLVEVPEYIDTVNLLSEKDVFYKEVFEEIKSYDNIKFIRQSEIKSIDNKDKSLFFNAGKNSHLNYKGSQLYTKEILDIISQRTSESVQ